MLLTFTQLVEDSVDEAVGSVLPDGQRGTSASSSVKVTVGESTLHLPLILSCVRSG